MEGPSEFLQLLQSYVIIAVGVLAIIVMFDSRTRRDQENRLSLILGHSGCSDLTDWRYLKNQAGSLFGDSRKVYGQSKWITNQGHKLVENGNSLLRLGLLKEGAVANSIYSSKKCDPASDLTCGLDDPRSFIEGYGIGDNTACHGKKPGTRIQCNLPENNNLNYYEGYANERDSYSLVDSGMMMEN